jgi:hypothetical protein
MGTLEQGLQEIHDAKIGVCITWLWDGGVDVRLSIMQFVTETNQDDDGFMAAERDCDAFPERRTSSHTTIGISNRASKSTTRDQHRDLMDRDGRSP